MLILKKKQEISNMLMNIGYRSKDLFMGKKNGSLVKVNIVHLMLLFDCCCNILIH